MVPKIYYKYYVCSKYYKFALNCQFHDFQSGQSFNFHPVCVFDPGQGREDDSAQKGKKKKGR